MNKIFTFLFFVCISTATASAEFADFSSQLIGSVEDVPVMTTDFSGGQITASVFSSQVSEGVRWAPRTLAGTSRFFNPEFTSLFGEIGQVIQVQSFDDPSKSTHINFTIDRPFPEGAHLIVMDMDGVNERVTLASNAAGANATFEAPVQMETATEDSTDMVVHNFPSAFPVWNQDAQMLRSTGLNMGQNNREASIFSVAGKSQFSVTISASQDASSWIGIATAVPEPSTLSLIMLVLVSLGRLRRVVA